MSPRIIRKSTYMSEIDGLRAFAVLSVVAFHAFPDLLKGGFIGVDVFFVISGFLITSHIFQNLIVGEFSFVDFYSRRIRRIFPALIIVMTCSLAFGWFVLLADEYAQMGKHIASGAGFILNFILVDEIGYFDNAAETKPMLHLWSLAVEEQFYIIWPLILWLAWKNQVNLLRITILVALISFIFSLRFMHSNPIENFFWPAGRFWELLSGSLLAWIFINKKRSLSKAKIKIDNYLIKITKSKNFIANGNGVSNIISFLGFSLLIYGVTGINKELAYPSEWTLIPTSASILIISAGTNAWLNRVILMNPISVWFGLISYPLYLWHWPILSFTQIIKGETPNIGIRLSGVLLSILLAWLTYRFFENPIRRQFIRAPKAKHLIALIFIIGLFSFYVNKSDGIQTRSVVKDYLSNLDELQRTIAKENSCLSFLGISQSKFNYCKIGKIGNRGTVAVIGDSHAHVAFPGISDGLEKLGYTTVLLANSSCPPFLNSPWGRNDSERLECSNRIEEILFNISNLPELNRVLIFSRGPIYWTGSEPSRKDKQKPTLNIDNYFEGLQRTIDRLKSLNIEVIYVTENPELKYNARSCLPRPLNTEVTQKCEQNLTSVLERQQEYRDRLIELKDVLILDSNKAFCRESDNKCFAFNDKNQLLYADDDHLSVIGSYFLYEKLLKHYFQ